MGGQCPLSLRDAHEHLGASSCKKCRGDLQCVALTGGYTVVSSWDWLARAAGRDTELCPPWSFFPAKEVYSRSAPVKECQCVIIRWFNHELHSIRHRCSFLIHALRCCSVEFGTLEHLLPACIYKVPTGPISNLQSLLVKISMLLT